MEENTKVEGKKITLATLIVIIINVIAIVCMIIVIGQAIIQEKCTNRINERPLINYLIFMKE